MLNSKVTKFSIRIVHLWILALVILFSACMNYDWHSSGLIWYGALGFLFIAYCCNFKGQIRIRNFSFLAWLLSFIALGAVSILWCLSVKWWLDVLKTLVINFAVLLLIQCSIDFDFSIDTILECYFIATLVNAFYLITTVDLAQFGKVQLGVNMIEGWNGNGIGFMMAQGALIGWYLFPKINGKLQKCIYLGGVLLFAFLTVYTGSRTAFIVLVAELLLYYTLSHPTKLVRNIFLSVVAVVAAFYLVMNVEGLYNVLGSRLEGLIALFSGEGKVDTSASIRDVFIENGKRWFLEEPILGYGLNNYKVLNGPATGRTVYAHNTFIEMAVNLGVVGLVWYYSAYVYLIQKLLKGLKNNQFNVFLLSALIASILSQYGTVSYYGFYQNFLLLMCFTAVSKAKKRTVNRV